MPTNRPPPPQNLPVLIGSSGGLNPAGRSGNFRGYGFMIRETLDKKEREEILIHQARLMNRIKWNGNGWSEAGDGHILAPGDIAAKFDGLLNDQCFIRKPDPVDYFDPYAAPVNRKVVLEEGEVLWPRKTLPQPLPEAWSVIGEDAQTRTVRIRISATTEIFVPQTDKLEVSCAGMIPDGVSLECKGFGTKGEKIPHGVKLALYAANDAMKNLGIPFEEISRVIPQDKIGLYIGSAMGQIDDRGLAGYMQAPFLDKHPASTFLPFSLNNMAADFVAAYVLGSLGHISCEVGACATFLFNCYNAIRDIRQGQILFALVGTADAPIESWAFNAYHSMKALARDEHLRAHRHLHNDDLARSQASIPFGENFGFTVAEGSQFITLFHPDLAKTLGVAPQGAIGEVFCHSDGWKDSISKPGIGNYLTLGRALGALERELGTESLRERSYVSAHGSSTPQNRLTESQMLSRFAKTFGIEKWPVTAVKSWLGHTLGSASGDQIVTALGAFHYRMIAKIRNLTHIPGDVAREHLHFCQDHQPIADGEMDCCLVNSKGFGGHNATGLIYSPAIARDWLTARMDQSERSLYEKACEKTQLNRGHFEREFLEGAEMIEYHSNKTFAEKDIEMLDKTGLRVRGLEPFIKF